MEVYINETPKGWRITRYSKDRKAFWVEDKEHSMLPSYVLAVWERGEYVEEGMFDEAFPKMRIRLCSKFEVGILRHKKRLDRYNPKFIAVMLYYKSLMVCEDNEDCMKFYIKRLKIKLSILGIDRMYEEIQQQDIQSFKLK